MSDLTYLLSIDPGLSSGVAMGTFSDTKPYSLVEGWQFGGGLTGLVDWLEGRYERDDDFSGGNRWNLGLTHGQYIRYLEGSQLIVACEKYVPLQGKGFSQTLDSTEPLRCEGALVALGVMPNYPDGTWRRANEMYFVGGTTKPEKRKRLKQFLKDTNNYRYGKDLGAPDNEDFVSAVAHGISYTMKVLKNRPTFLMVSDWTNNE